MRRISTAVFKVQMFLSGPAECGGRRVFRLKKNLRTTEKRKQRGAGGRVFRSQPEPENGTPKLQGGEEAPTDTSPVTRAQPDQPARLPACETAAVALIHPLLLNDGESCRQGVEVGVGVEMGGCSVPESGFFRKEQRLSWQLLYAIVQPPLVRMNVLIRSSG